MRRIDKTQFLDILNLPNAIFGSSDLFLGQVEYKILFLFLSYDVSNFSCTKQNVVLNQSKFQS